MRQHRAIPTLVLAAALTAATGCVAAAGVPGPPPPRVDVHGVAPSPVHAWIGGHWAWRGGWVWVGGAWAVRPRAGAVWVPGHWGHGRHWVDGHWR